MGIIYIGIALGLTAIVLGVIQCRSTTYCDFCVWIILCTALSLFIVIFGGVTAIGATVNDDLKTQELAEQHATITYRLENQNSEDSLMVNGGLYNDLVEYNTEIRKYKKWTHNFWFGCFYEDGPAELDLISIPETP